MQLKGIRIAFGAIIGKIAVGMDNDHDLHTVRSSKDDPLRYMCLGFSFCKEHPDFEKYLPLYNFFEHLENPIAEDHFKLFDCFTLALNEISAPTLMRRTLIVRGAGQVTDLKNLKQTQIQGLVQKLHAQMIFFLISVRV